MSFSQQAIDAFYEGDLKKVDELIDKAVIQDDDDHVFNLGDTLLSMGQSVQAKQIFLKLLKKNPNADELKTRLAEINISDGDNDTALEYLTDISSDSYAYAEALITLADLYQTLGLYEVSEQKLLEGLRMFPDEYVFKFALAELYYAQANYQKALDFYEILLDEDITELSGIQIYERLGDSLASTGEFEKAIVAYDKINQLSINEDILYKKGNLYYQTKAYQKAEDTLEELLELNHDYIPAYLLLSNTLYEETKYSEAYNTALNGIRYDEYNGDLYKALLVAAKKTDNMKEAEKLTENGLAKVEDPNSLIRIISDYFYENEEYDKNIFLINNFEKGADDPYLLWNLAKSYRELDDVANSKKNIMLAYNELQNNMDFMRDVVLILRDSGDLAVAKDALEKYLKLNPEDEYMRNIFGEY